MMTLTAAVLYAATALGAPERGLLARIRNRRAAVRKAELQDVVKQMALLHEQNALALPVLAERAQLRPAKLRRRLGELRRMGWVDDAAELPALTAAGQAEAQRLIRAHRVWETYLTTRAHQKPEDVHPEAERAEHRLPDAFVAALHRELGAPRRDPHGAWIPGAAIGEPFPLAELPVGVEASLCPQQAPEAAQALWRMGLSATAPLRRADASPASGLAITQAGRVFSLDAGLARVVCVQRLSPAEDEAAAGSGARTSA